MNSSTMQCSHNRGRQAQHVHIVDPNIERRASISRELSDRSIHAEIYEDVQELVTRCPDKGALLIADEPATDADEALETIRSHCGHFPAVYYSANPSPEQIVKAMLGGALAYLQWPFSDDALCATVERLREQGTQQSKAETLQAEAQGLVERLTKRQRDVLVGIVAGGSNKSIARDLGLSSRTVEIHRAELMTRLDAHSVADVVRIALHAGMESPPHRLSGRD